MTIPPKVLWTAAACWCVYDLVAVLAFGSSPKLHISSAAHTLIFSATVHLIARADR